MSKSTRSRRSTRHRPKGRTARPTSSLLPARRVRGTGRENDLATKKDVARLILTAQKVERRNTLRGRIAGELARIARAVRTWLTTADENLREDVRLQLAARDGAGEAER